MLSVVAFLVLLGFGLNVLGSLAELPLGRLVAAAAAVVAGRWAYLHGDRFVLRANVARPVQAGDPSTAVLVNVVAEMAVAAGVPAPSVYVIDDPDPNAFTIGRDPQHASIVVTRGLVGALTRDELQAVVAHEVAHIRNRDTLKGTLVAALLGGPLLLGDWAWRSFEAARGGDAREHRRLAGAFGDFVIRLLGVMPTPLVARALATMVSRQQEYLADATAVQLSRNPASLASALGKLAAAGDPTRRVAQGTAHLCIVDPLGRPINEQHGRLADLLATHPPIEARMSRLRAMAGAGGGVIEASPPPERLSILEPPPRPVPLSLAITRLVNRRVLWGTIILALGANLASAAAQSRPTWRPFWACWWR